jgi:4a-hydroxytetrahydrobiopterin dehydratase
MNQTATTAELTRKHCQPCEGGVPVLSDKQVQQLLKEVEGWRVTDDGKKIQRQWRLKDFTSCLDFFNKVGQIAEAEGHHPDLHLTGYRNAMIEISTHAIGGLSENDFILAAKIDQVAPKAPQ